MKNFFIIITLLFSLQTLQGQDLQYLSKLTEYRFLKNNSVIPFEWIDRDIFINENSIKIISKSKNTTEIQTWSISNKVKNLDDTEINTVYYVHKSNTEYAYEDPSIFIVYENKEGKVEIIDWQIPPLEESESLEPRVTRFHIN